MQFVSTRGESPPVGFGDAILSAYAPDGGLYVPERLPALPADKLASMKDMGYPEVAATVLALFAGDSVPFQTLLEMATEAYGPRSFQAADPLPLHKLEKGLFVLETFHGPTAAFKDIGLQMVSRLLSYFLNKQGRSATVVVETSGDTGPAALQACAGVPGVQIMCLFPKGRVSRIQELQLTTAQGDASNLHVYQTHGNTDDQAMVLKEIFSDKSFCDQHGVCSINSINVGRVVTQASYYVYAYLRAVKRGCTGADPTPLWGLWKRGCIGILTWWGLWAGHLRDPDLVGVGDCGGATADPDPHGDQKRLAVGS
ncbi:hypothetical protein CYMTET_15241 [Cymbomonas tetramitiformis]|uniref:Threonine synthase n=1 Tax=Cymbomonas tetramitiformis TaxID=36881 RepID=A0AAE0L9J5_9CHLO|nr:hypothetical protein CYMTET_15241 [Cymbomonas tetramitiformis]